MLGAGSVRVNREGRARDGACDRCKTNTRLRVVIQKSTEGGVWATLCVRCAVLCSVSSSCRCDTSACCRLGRCLWWQACRSSSSPARDSASLASFGTSGNTLPYCSFLSSSCGCSSPLCLGCPTVLICSGAVAVSSGKLPLYLTADALVAMISFFVWKSSESTLILRKIFYSAANTRSGCQRPAPRYLRMARNSPSCEYARHGVSTSS